MFKAFRKIGKLFVNVNVKVKESWEIEGPVGFTPTEPAPRRVLKVGNRLEVRVSARIVWKKIRQFNQLSHKKK